MDTRGRLRTTLPTKALAGFPSPCVAKTWLYQGLASFTAAKRAHLPPTLFWPTQSCFTFKVYGDHPLDFFLLFPALKVLKVADMHEKDTGREHLLRVCCELCPLQVAPFPCVERAHPHPGRFYPHTVDSGENSVRSED